MFDLDNAIKEWRLQMFAAGVKTPVPLDELEGHLRDDIEHEMQSGTGAREAFETAVQRIGPAKAIYGEFKKTCGPKRNAMLWCGSLGLALTVILNLAGFLVLHKASSAIFSDQWWSDWLPNYIAWTVFTIIGITGRTSRQGRNAT